MLHNDHNVKDSVAICVLSIWVSSLLYQNVVDSFIAETGSPGQGVLPQVRQALIVGGGSWHSALLVLGVEEGASGAGADISSGLYYDLRQLIIAIGYGQVQSCQATVLLALTIITQSVKCCKYNRDSANFLSLVPTFTHQSSQIIILPL